MLLKSHHPPPTFLVQKLYILNKGKLHNIVTKDAEPLISSNQSPKPFKRLCQKSFGDKNLQSDNLKFIKVSKMTTIPLVWFKTHK